MNPNPINDKLTVQPETVIEIKAILSLEEFSHHYYMQ